MVCALLPSEAEASPKDDGASPSPQPSAKPGSQPSGGFFGSFFGREQPEQARAGGEEAEAGEAGERACHASDEAGEREGAMLTKQLQAPPFAHVLGAACAAGVRRSRSEDVIAACAALGLPPCAVMLVSDQARALGAARGARAFSCYMRKQLASAPQRVPRDAHVESEPDMATLRRPGPRQCEGISWFRSAERGLLRAN